MPQSTPTKNPSRKGSSRNNRAQTSVTLKRLKALEPGWRFTGFLILSMADLISFFFFLSATSSLFYITICFLPLWSGLYIPFSGIISSLDTSDFFLLNIWRSSAEQICSNLCRKNIQYFFFTKREHHFLTSTLGYTKEKFCPKQEVTLMHTWQSDDVSSSLRKTPTERYPWVPSLQIKYFKSLGLKFIHL